MRIKLGNWVICTAKSVKDKLTAAKSKGMCTGEYYWRCVGVYDTRILGIVFYRNEDYDWA